MNAAAPGTGPNYVFWLIWILPASAVLASFASLYFALHGGDVPLPTAYHWEGHALDGDQARQEQARHLGIAALLQFDAVDGQCHLRLQGDSPAELRVDLAHPTIVADDQHWVMKKDGDGYRAPCSALPKAHWWVQIADPTGRWQLRGRLTSDFRGEPIYLTADAKAG